MYLLRLLLIVIGLCSGIGPINSAANTLPNQAEVLEKCGEARLTVMFWDVYDSTLYAPQGDYRPGVRPLRLEIRYLRNIKAKDLVKQTRKEWQAQGVMSPQHADWLTQLEAFWPDVADNDVITLDLDTAGTSTFSFNGSVVGQISDSQFGEDFAGIWLAPTTTRPELRAALIGSNASAES